MPDVQIERSRPSQVTMLRVFRPAEDVQAAVGHALDTAMPDRPQVSERGAVHWLGQGHWMILDREADDVARRIGAMNVVPIHHVSDMTAAFTAFDLKGSGAIGLIAKGCTLDLHPRVFPVGGCAGTVLAQVDLLLVKIADDHFRIYCDRGVADHLQAWLDDADERGVQRRT